MATFQLSSANAKAILRPIPWLPPVTSAYFPLISKSIFVIVKLPNFVTLSEAKGLKGIRDSSLRSE